MDKTAIREVEEHLPPITESVMNMNSIDRLLGLMPYHHAGEQLMFGQTGTVTISDIGCGDGLFLRAFFSRISNRRSDLMYIGVELSLNKIHLAKKVAKSLRCVESHFILADAENLPFKSSVFDVSIVIEVLEHLLDPCLFISELARTIKPNERAIVTTPSACGTKGNLFNVLERFFLLRQSVNQIREKYVTIQGKRLPHRDFAYSELANIMLPQFSIVLMYSFNFGAIYHALTKVLPRKMLAFLILYLENHAIKLPNVWGNNWLICAKKNCENIGL